MIILELLLLVSGPISVIEIARIVSNQIKGRILHDLEW
jgi:hypothetical protein